MPEEPTTERIIFNSEVTHGVDAKRRVQIPARWRPKKGSIEFTLILWPKYQVGACLRVLPPWEMDKLLRTLNAMPNDDPNKTVLKRIIGTQSVQVVPDKAGRICLPEEMARAAGIKDKAVLAGLIDRFEIWNPERYAQIRAADEAKVPDAFRTVE
ncbi:MAG: hypothetical protein N3I86_05275 [Verrucomicrobiae bacterium]|nr:hypothetical protein [Verrucomicrobiae bacterium]MDW8308985.1 hypothetical protein [Verrucomicrobiales bacterium]